MRIVTCMSAQCANCHAIVAGPYCSQCGQQAADPRVNIWTWIRRAIDEQFNVNAKLPRTVWLLFTRPGFITAEWRAGRRAHYIEPLRLYVIAFAAFLTTLFLAGDMFESAFLWAARDADPTTVAAAESAVRETFRRFMIALQLTLVPTLALLLKVVFWRRGIYLVEHLVFSLHLHVVGLIVLAVVWLLTSIHYLLGLTFVLALIFVLVYMMRAMRRVYGGEERQIALLQVVVLAGYLTLSAVGTGVFSRILGPEVQVYNELIYADVMQRQARRNAFDTYRKVMARAQTTPPERLASELRDAIDAHNDIGLPLEHRPHNLYHRAELYLLLGDTLNARRYTERGIKWTSPLRPAFVSVYARIYEARGDSAGARQLYGQFLETYPTGELHPEVAAHRPLLEWTRARASAYNQTSRR